MTSATPTYPVGTIAKLLMVSERRIQQLSADGVIPKSDRGRYELAPAVQGYIKFLQNRSVDTSSGAVDYHAEKALLTKAQRQTAEVELARLTGEVAYISEFERTWAAKCAAIRQNCLNIPSRAVLQLLGCTDEKEFKQVLKAEITLALDTAAEAEVDILDDDEDAQDKI